MLELLHSSDMKYPSENLLFIESDAKPFGDLEGFSLIIIV